MTSEFAVKAKADSLKHTSAPIKKSQIFFNPTWQWKSQTMVEKRDLYHSSHLMLVLFTE